MKRFLSIVLVIIMCVSLCACSTEMNDAGFITNLTKGLEARWKLSSRSTTATTATAYKEHLIPNVFIVIRYSSSPSIGAWCFQAPAPISEAFATYTLRL